jgi:hypothetical protein
MVQKEPAYWSKLELGGNGQERPHSHDSLPQRRHHLTQKRAEIDRELHLGTGTEGHFNPGQIYGRLDLTKAVQVDQRTTGGDPMHFTGPRIQSKNLTVEVAKVMRCPIWIQTSDNQWFKAQSPGNVSSQWLKRLWPWRTNKPVTTKGRKLTELRLL